MGVYVCKIIENTKQNGITNSKTPCVLEIDLIFSYRFLNKHTIFWTGYNQIYIIIPSYKKKIGTKKKTKPDKRTKSEHL